MLPAQWTGTAQLPPELAAAPNLARLESIWAAVEHGVRWLVLVAGDAGAGKCRLLMDVIRYTSKRGRAWHNGVEHQGSEANHYEHAIPVAEVRPDFWLARCTRRSTGAPRPHRGVG